MNKLNGWQRIFVVYSVIHLVIAGCVLIGSWPDKDRFYWGDIEPRLKPWDKALILYSGYSEPTKGIGLTIKFDTGSFVTIDDVSKEKVDRFVQGLKTAQAEEHSDAVKEHITSVLMGAFIPLVIIYALGWSFGWIVRGFKSNKGA